jgi:hypothetical protein
MAGKYLVFKSLHRKPAWHKLRSKHNSDVTIVLEDVPGKR